MPEKKRTKINKVAFKPTSNKELPIKVLLAGEGVTDHGELIPSGKICQSVKHDGACQPLIRKCADDRDMEFLVAERWIEFSTFNAKKMPSKKEVPGHGQKSYACTMLANIYKCPIVVVFIDGDKSPRKDSPKPKTDRAVRKRIKELRSELEIGFKKAREQLGDKIGTIRMVPMRMIESWIMADRNAFKTVTGVDPSLILKGKKLEGLWGDKKDPESYHPKKVLDWILVGSGFDRNRETVRLIAEQIDLETLVAECPYSAKPFVDEGKAVLSTT